MNPKLYLRDPEQSPLGRNIIQHSIRMIHKIGFEDFTFKKLATEIGTTEASIYRYFENKHKLLTYLIAWLWTWLEYQLIYHTNNVTSPKEKINVVIKLLTFQLSDQFTFTHIDKNLLYQIAITEGSKSYLTKHVTQDNKDRFFKPYKDLCGRIAEIFKEYNNSYKYPRSLSSTLLEMAHYQFFFKKNLPSLTDFGNDKDDTGVVQFLQHMVFTSLKKER
ncbi:TetR/AcrR family transcriptional regulator [Terrimonas sp. NA20]|uniref:TetR/AcrR family transcriptional regulator n=1 Tax=Terrimonas ginsenosidimutans TaxID=2908004 RepID=A0ABS9KVB1_9BACT|nr:TetR/AcrR family transcriptional regulator [Terrimonas ginsenosidimutans]MCG2616261.1 TetR/AcrR family transcriptional regulator [Terrimonas ginsenosidimutans]